MAASVGFSLAPFFPLVCKSRPSTQTLCSASVQSQHIRTVESLDRRERNPPCDSTHRNFFGHTIS